MPSNPSRRARIAAIAATADYNPEEAAVAQAMLERLPESQLDTIATDIKALWHQGIEGQFEIGRQLAKAAEMFPTHTGGKGVGVAHGGSVASPYGLWFDAQNFPFSRQTGWRLRDAASRETEVRAYISSHSALSGSKDILVTTAIDAMRRKPKYVSIPTEETTPVDPAFASLRDARTAVLGWDGERTTHNAFTSMHVDDLRESAVILKALLDAYNETRSARA